MYKVILWCTNSSALEKFTDPQKSATLFCCLLHELEGEEIRVPSVGLLVLLRRLVCSFCMRGVKCEVRNCQGNIGRLIVQLLEMGKKASNIQITSGNMATVKHFGTGEGEMQLKLVEIMVHYYKMELIKCCVCSLDTQYTCKFMHPCLICLTQCHTLTVFTFLKPLCTYDSRLHPVMILSSVTAYRGNCFYLKVWTLIELRSLYVTVLYI